MKIHTANYIDTFIEVAEDTKVNQGTIPPVKDKRTVAQIQYELISGNPYRYSSDDILFQVYAERNNIPENEYKQAREQFFSKGQPCFRASPLTKNYGFGLHSNGEGKIALYGMETGAYRQFLADTTIKKVKAMKSGK
ncbi:DUF6157 family protein [uncultured Proteiniphilum sp.]|uniref:DUF6157 family protein n=1 Tax=uncultured Proteiniphilum sp. TaxID=497637 RepID=UPI0026119A71|nr:DUF6157 family protein [uncultured Proteiniphilum sp.]